jgi:hypothetical protein
MHMIKHLLVAAAVLPLVSCSSNPTCAPAEACTPQVLLQETFEGEKDRYELNFNDFTRWEVIQGSVDLVGTPPFDDFLPTSQGMYVDLDGTSKAAGTLRSRERFTLTPGRYRLELKIAGTPRPDQAPNTVIISVGNAFRETVTMESYAPLQTFVRTFRVSTRDSGHLMFAHLGGDDYGIFIDDIRFERL